MNNNGTNASNRAETVPVRRFELIDWRGQIFGPYPSGAAALKAAQEKWPDQEQDPERTGKGWDLREVGGPGRCAQTDDVS